MKRILIARFQLDTFKREAKRVAHEIKVVSDGKIVIEKHHIRLDVLAWACGYKDYNELAIVARTATASDGALCLADSDEKRDLLCQRWLENPFVRLEPLHIEHVLKKLDWKGRRAIDATLEERQNALPKRETLKLRPQVED